MDPCEPKINESTCVWSGIYDDHGRESLDNVLYTVGLVTSVLGLWMCASITTSRLFSNNSYRNLTNYTLAATLRRSTIGGLHFMPFVNYLYAWDKFSFIECELFGFCETFIAVFEIESLTMVCIERYVLAKYASKGWTVPSNYNYLYGSLCVFFAFAYAFPPLLGIGQYAKDFDCRHCTLDLILPQEQWKKYIVVLIFFMRSIKPCIIMLLMLYWARKLEIKRADNEAERKLTEGVALAVACYIVCGLPIAILRGSEIVSQLNYGQIMKVSEFSVTNASIFHWLSAALAMCGMTVSDPQLQDLDFFINEPNNEPVTSAIQQPTGRRSRSRSTK